MNSSPLHMVLHELQIPRGLSLRFIFILDSLGFYTKSITEKKINQGHILYKIDIIIMTLKF